MPVEVNVHARKSFYSTVKPVCPDVLGCDLHGDAAKTWLPTSCCRGYTGKKLEDNVQCEIFQTILEEAQGAYKPDIVHELPSNTPDDMEENLDKITAWVEEWKKRTLS